LEKGSAIQYVRTWLPDGFCFQTKNTNLGKFWRVLQWKLLVYLMAIWSIYSHLVYFVAIWKHFMVIWYIFPRFGMLHQEKSGNPGPNLCFSNGF
jgi:hypothetical protein